MVNKLESTYIKSGRGRGRPKKILEIAKTKTTINQFFAPAQQSARTE